LREQIERQMSLLFVACVLVDVIRALASSRELLSPGSAETAHATRGALKGSIFFSDPFLSGLDYELVSLRPVCYRLVSAFSIPVDSPRDKRGKSCSRNCGLGFRIRACFRLKTRSKWKDYDRGTRRNREKCLRRNECLLGNAPS